MSEPTKKALVPVLRFSEFLDSAEWCELKINDIASAMTDYVANGSFQSLRENVVIEDSKNFALYVRLVDLRAGIGHPGQKYVDEMSYQFLKKSALFGQELLMANIGANVGEVWQMPDIDMPATLAPNMIMTKFKSNANSRFIYYFLDSEFGQKRISCAVSGSGHPKINKTDLKQIKVLLPSMPKEQQKIAECLTSIDDLITAQTQKLAVLKVHKKGLMQQLFPSEGETVPKLRFPEFRDAGEWEERRLGDACERILDGTHFSPKSKSGPRLYLTSKNIQNGEIDMSNISYISEEEHREIYKRCPVKKNDVLLTKDGANTGNCALNSIDYEFSLLSSVAVLRGITSLIEQRFLYQLILADRTQKTIQESMSGQAITRITLEKIGNFVILITSIDEQQKVADCLSSIDDLITAQTQKLAALKAHKKGLMQQLFPNTETEHTP